MAKTTLILGIIAFVLSLTPLISGWCLFLMYIVWILAVLAIIFGIIGLVKKQSLAKCIIGMALCIVASFMPRIFAQQFAEKAADTASSAFSMFDN